MHYLLLLHTKIFNNDAKKFDLQPYKNRRNIMRELIGNCASCNKEVYCNGGFLDGVIQENKSLLCFTCYKKIKKKV